MAIPATLDGEIFRRKLKRDYSEYVKYTNPGFCMTKMHKYLCTEIQNFLEAKTENALDILLLSVPPQHGKSYTVTETLPSWFLGNNPEDAVIIAGYEGTFAEAFSRRNRDKFNEYGYDIFRIKPNDAVQGVALWETEKGGRCRAAGLKGGITGHPCELFIIDDPIKNKEMAMSESIIAKIHSEMVPSVQSRIHPGGKLIVIQTRWVENDVIGYIEEHWSEFIWKSINLPCECEDEENDPLGRKLGEALMGEHLGDYNIPQKIRNDNKWLKSKKQLVLAADGEYEWNALYQGHPSAEQGNLFHREWWKHYNRSEFGSVDKFEYIHLSIDATFKGTETSDFVAWEMWGIYKGNAYLWELGNKRMGFVKTLEYIRSYNKKYPTLDELIIEGKANGPAIIDVIKYDQDCPPIVDVNPLGGKYSRAEAVSSFVAAGHCFIPDDITFEEDKDIEWPDKKAKYFGSEKFVEQLARFPYMKNDDMVDSCSQSLSRLIKLITGEEPKPERRFLRFTKWYPDMWEDYENMNSYEQEQFIRTYGAPLEWENL